MDLEVTVVSTIVSNVTYELSKSRVSRKVHLDWLIKFKTMTPLGCYLGM